MTNTKGRCNGKKVTEMKKTLLHLENMRITRTSITRKDITDELDPNTILSSPNWKLILKICDTLLGVMICNVMG